MPEALSRDTVSAIGDAGCASRANGNFQTITTPTRMTTTAVALASSP